MSAKRYLVAAAKPWNRRIFEETIRAYPGEWHFVSDPAQLTVESVEALDPRYLFFPHWSWIVPTALVERWECVCFHMTDVPFGRGGSPLQNLVSRGHRETKLTALRMTDELDAGPVYLKRPLSLEGDAEEIYLRAAELTAGMIREIAEAEPAPVAQEGEPTVFRRRKPAESEIPPVDGLLQLHDFIRMLDADGYPRAYLEHAGFRYELSRAALREGRILADVTITPIDRET